MMAESGEKDRPVMSSPCPCIGIPRITTRSEDVFGRPPKAVAFITRPWDQFSTGAKPWYDDLDQHLFTSRVTQVSFDDNRYHTRRHFLRGGPHREVLQDPARGDLPDLDAMVLCGSRREPARGRDGALHHLHAAGRLITRPMCIYSRPTAASGQP